MAEASDYDVIVIGSGAAGLCAALEAERAGARVLISEAEGVVGGSSRLSGGIMLGAGTRYQDRQGITDSADDMYRHYMTLNGWQVQPSLARTFCDNAGPTIDWLGDLGLEFLGVYSAGDEFVPRGHVTKGGEDIVAVLHSAVRASNTIDIALGRRIDRLLVENGRVVGVAVGEDSVRSGATVLACGGLGANKKMLADFCPSAIRAGRDWLWYVGADGSRGDGITLTLPLGAQIVGRDRVQLTTRPNFGHSIEANFPGWLMTVNASGQRFYDELSPYSVTQTIILAQEGPVFALFDDAMKQDTTPDAATSAKKEVVPGRRSEDWAGWRIDEMIKAGVVHQADTIEQLAKAISVPPENLAYTVERYNGHAMSGFDADYLKNPKNMKPISTPPFYATELRPHMIGLTAVGPRIDPMCRLLGSNSEPIPGLFGAGECTGGVLGPMYAGSGNSLANAVTFGRIAGRNAAAIAVGDR